MRIDMQVRLEAEAYSGWQSATCSECGRDRDGNTGGVLVVIFNEF